MKKHLISSIASMAIIMNTMGFDLTANAKVIEPEIVKTETWTTSYYIDDDMATLYPYIDCQADIYNDGTVKVYFWNTHEWDGFATVKHKVTIINTRPFNELDKFKIQDRNSYPFDISYYPKEYNMISRGSDSMFINYPALLHIQSSNFYSHLSGFQYEGALPELPVNKKSGMEFKPQVDPTGKYDFYLLGYQFSVTPDILSGNIIADPQISETEQKIKELEEKIANLESENASLRAENEQLKNGLISDSYGDINHDNIIDGRDASMLLTYYAKTSTGYTGTLEEYVESVKETES